MYGTLTAYGCVLFNLKNGNTPIVTTNDVLSVQNISINNVVTVIYGQHKATMNDKYVMLQNLEES